MNDYIYLYEKQIDYYNCTTYEILVKEISLILPTYPKDKTSKRGIITLLITGFISLAYKGISIFLHHKQHKALHKAFMAMEKKVDMQRNKIFHLKDSMVMFGIYNSDAFEQLIDMVHKMHNHITFNEKLFARKILEWSQWYLSKDGVAHYVPN